MWSFLFYVFFFCAIINAKKGDNCDKFAEHMEQKINKYMKQTMKSSKEYNTMFEQLEQFEQVSTNNYERIVTWGNVINKHVDNKAEDNCMTESDLIDQIIANFVIDLDDMNELRKNMAIAYTLRHNTAYGPGKQLKQFYDDMKEVLLRDCGISSSESPNPWYYMEDVDISHDKVISNYLPDYYISYDEIVEFECSVGVITEGCTRRLQLLQASSIALKALAKIAAALGIKDVWQAVLSVLEEDYLELLENLGKAFESKSGRFQAIKDILGVLVSKEFLQKLGAKIGEEAAEKVIGRVLAKFIPIVGWGVLIGDVLLAIGPQIV